LTAPAAAIMAAVQATMTIPPRACALLISAIQVTTMAVIRIAAGVPPARGMEIIPGQALVPDLALMAARDLVLVLTAAAAMTIIMEAGRRSSSEAGAFCALGGLSRRYFIGFERRPEKGLLHLVSI
jgi:hypothetical protein